MYNITDYTKRQAKKEGVIVKPSTNKNKKIDVFDKTGNKLASIGGIKPDGTPYMDYPNYRKGRGKAYADERRRLYLIRHGKDKEKKDGKFTLSYWAKTLLW